MSQSTTQSNQVLIQLALANDELRLQLAEMKGQNIALEKQLIQKQPIIEDIQKIKDLEEKLNIVMKETNKLKLEHMKSNYLGALRDTILYGNLGETINIKYKDALKRLRKNSISECHYIIYDKTHPNPDEDTQDEINYKIKILIDQMYCMPVEIKQYFDNTYGVGLLNELIITIQKMYGNCKNDPSIEERQDIADYWK